MFRYLTRLVGEAEAEDVTQGVMLKVSRGLATFRGDSSVSTWIYTIATHAALDRMRLASTTPRADVELEAEEGEVPVEMQAPSIESTAIREEMNACVRDFISRLPERYRIPLVLSDIEGFTNEEIATILHVTLGTAKIRLHRARERLRQSLRSGCDFYRRDDDAELACDRKAVAAHTRRSR